jgi:hypothetical protein
MVVQTVIVNDQATKGHITLRYGVFGADNVRAGLTITDYYISWSHTWSIPGHVSAWINGDRVDDADTVVLAGQVLEFKAP